MASNPPVWFEFASAVPLAAAQQLGLGPYARRRRASASRLTSMSPSRTTLISALDTAGVTGCRIVSVLLWHRGSVAADALAAETPGANADDLAESIARLSAAGIVTSSAAGGLRLTPAAAEVLEPIGVSLADEHAITSDQLGQICKALAISPAPNRKQERIDAIASVFSDPDARHAVMAGLSEPARTLLDQIADVAGPATTDTDAVGLPMYSLHLAATPRYAVHRDGSRMPDEVAPLAELTAHGIVGVAEWGAELWIWREAWPLLERPLFDDWEAPAVPATAPVTESGLRLPAFVGLAERALQYWDQAPPAVLKSGDRRLAKGLLRSTAKALATDEATIEVIAAAALSMGLLLPNVVRASGRGRKRTVDEVWLADPEVRTAWSAASAPTRWLRLVAEWANPDDAGGSQQLVANRHLVLWELAALPEGVGWVDEADAARWIDHRHAPVGVDEAVAECLRDLRALGMVTVGGPVALTDLGRLALDDPKAVERADFGSATEAIVQADETIVCPPDLDPDLVVQLGKLAKLESDSGARIFRLDETLITKAVQRGDSPEHIVEFLDGLSSVPLPDTVRRLVTDAADRAERVRIVEAKTVVVTADPVDLATACKLKSAKLTAVNDTVAVSTLAADKVRQILDRKGLAPTVVAAGDNGVTPRKSSDDALHYERAAQRQRELADRHQVDGLEHQATLLEQQAAAAGNPSSKLSVRGPLAVTPGLLERVRT